MCESKEIEVQRHAREVITGWVLALWALGLGVYLTLGGVNGLTSPAYSVLMKTVHHHNEWVGYTLLVAGIVHVSAVLLNRTLLVAIAALLCGLWCAAMSFCMGWAAFTIPGAGNMNTFTSGLAAYFFFMRFLAYRRPQFVWLK